MQTVWLTAILPPAFEEAFLQQNILIQPHLIRESTNRSNLQYRINRYDGEQELIAAAVNLARTYCAALSGNAKGRLIIYCQTIDLMREVAEALSCSIYTGDRDVMTLEEQEEALTQWEGPTGSPAIAATSALSVGYNYPYVRCVIHAGPPRCLTDFSQESG
jgi:superfamily II DNA helicase RecQ